MPASLKEAGIFYDSPHINLVCVTIVTLFVKYTFYI